MSGHVRSIRVVVDSPESDTVDLGASSKAEELSFKIVDGERADHILPIRATTFFGLCQELGSFSFHYCGPDPFEGGFIFQTS